MMRCLLVLAVVLGSAGVAMGQAIGARGTVPNLESNVSRALRYRAEGGDFVIENGAEFFNRPLYGRNTAFRVDAGDKPEFTMYLPGRGGNLRLGIRAGGVTKWLADGEKVEARYRPGEMLYEVRDAVLGTRGALTVGVVALNETDGIAVRVEGKNVAAGVEWVWAYGGVNGERGARDGDIGTERLPISEYFQLKPEFCADNQFSTSERTFVLRSKAATVTGLLPEGAVQALGDAGTWATFEGLEKSAAGNGRPARPVVIGHAPLPASGAAYLVLQRVGENAGNEDLATYKEAASTKPGTTGPATVAFRAAYAVGEMARVFEDAEKYYAALRTRVSIDTPDAYINAAVGAMNLAADAVWDEPQQNVMHGAIAWRTRLLGWRGPTAMDDLGWHDRAEKYATFWAGQQNVQPIPEKIPPADAKDNLSRNETGLHSNGDLSNSHYDMNLAYIDAVFRHLLWTGDVALARKLWPVIERHLAWERRLFRREFGPEKLPLYEAYAAIWASDDLEYNGGGTAHASAYNYFHNVMAGRLAKLIGEDAGPYEREAELIGKGMRAFLWMEDAGAFAEYKDLLGRQMVHPSAGLWTFYTTIDSGAATPEEAWRMAAALDRSLPRIPISGPGVPDDRAYHMLPSTNWMPYSWSINNVVMGENIHTALGYWKAGRPKEAFRITKGALLASMYMGICPGNVGTMNYLDVYRRESQRDFADGCAVMSRGIIEGLFGVRPDALAGEMRISPGFPKEWEHAGLKHPDVHVEFTRKGLTDTWTVGTTGAVFKWVVLRVPATHERVGRVDVDGVAAAWKNDAAAVGAPAMLIDVPGGKESVVHIVWDGAAIDPVEPDGAQESALTAVTQGQFTWKWARPVGEPLAAAAPVFDWRAARPVEKCEAVELGKVFNDRVTQIFGPMKYKSPRSPYVSLAQPAQGIGAWAGHVNATAVIDDTGLRAAAGKHGGRLVLPNGVPLMTPSDAAAANVVFTSQYDNYPKEVMVGLSGRAVRVYLLMAGSTYFMQSRVENGEVVVAYADGTTARLALVNPTNWWPIDQDYFIDDYQFKRGGAIPPRVNLRTGEVRLLDEETFKGNGGVVNGGAATVLEMGLDAGKELKSVTVRALANEVVVGLMAVTVERP